MSGIAIDGPLYGTIDWRMETHNYPVKPETISRWVREGRMSQRSAALLRGSAAVRGFRGRIRRPV
jgi:hypothetical protein